MLETTARSAADATRLPGRKSATASAKARPEPNRQTAGKVRLVTTGDLDGRTVAARRSRELAATFAAELDPSGNLTPTQRLAVERAATLTAVSEDAQTRRLAGDHSVSLEDLVRIDNAARRAVRDLNIRPGARSDEPNLADYLRQIGGHEAADASIEEPGTETPEEAETRMDEPAGLPDEAK